MSVDKSSSQVANEAEDTRANLASTLEQLRANLRPENVMEEVVTNARAGASQVADNLAGIARQYPIPSVLMAVGSALVMRLFNGKGDAASTGADAGSPRPVTTRPPMLRNPSAFEASPSGMAGTVDAARGSPRISRERTVDRSRFAVLLDEQPLILGVIGLAVGAAIGAALPITETEDQVMGGTSHRLRDSATDAARQEIDGLRAAAGEAVQNVRQSATDSLHGFVKDVGDNAKGVVDKAGGTLTGGGKDV